MSFKKLLGLDLGQKKVGLAFCDQSWLVASHHKTILREKLEPEIHNMREKIAALIIGLPLKMDGSSGTAAQNIKQIGQALSKQVDLPVFYEDERLTSWQARQILQENGYKPLQVKKLEHQVSAQLILQSFLNSPQAQKFKNTLL